MSSSLRQNPGNEDSSLVSHENVSNQLNNMTGKNNTRDGYLPQNRKKKKKRKKKTRATRSQDTAQSAHNTNEVKNTEKFEDVPSNIGCGHNEPKPLLPPDSSDSEFLQDVRELKLPENEDVYINGVLCVRGELAARPVLFQPDHLLLKGHAVSVLERKSMRYPRAVYYCNVCNYHCDNLEVVKHHVVDSRHTKSIENKVNMETLKNLPDATEFHTRTLDTFVRNVLSKRALSFKDYEYGLTLFTKLNTFVMNELPGCSLRMYGSVATGLALKTSDINLELVVGSDSDSPSELKHLADLLNLKGQQFGKVEYDFTAAVPAVTVHTSNGVRCVIAITNHPVYMTSKLIASYVQLDKRVKTLCLMLRIFALDCELDNPEKGTWPSFAFALMTIYFLQQLEKPVLPNFHDILERKDMEYSPDIDVFDVCGIWKSENFMSIGELWLKLLKFYALEFSANENVVSITQTRMLRRDAKRWTGRKLAIEDPCRPKHNISKCITNMVSFDFAMNCFKNAYKYFSIPNTGASPIFRRIIGEKCNHDQEYLNHILLPEEKFQTLLNCPVFNGNSCKCDANSCLSIDITAVTVNQAKVLCEKFNPKFLKYDMRSDIFRGGQDLPISCNICLNDGHWGESCPEVQVVDICGTPVLEESFLNAINTFFSSLEGTFLANERDITVRQKIVDDLQDFVIFFIPSARFKLFGSSCNGFGLCNSDVDISLTFKDNETGEDIDFIKCVEDLEYILKRYENFKHLIPITTARVPILKFSDISTELNGDISIYNILAQRNTKLLHAYSSIDPRVRLLGCVVKKFAKVSKICDASKGSLSSYAYVLMVIFFLQRCEPPVLPVLQEIPTPGHKSNIVEGYETYFYDDLKTLPSVWLDFGKNTSTLAELWLQFLWFYLNFDFKTYVISIRQMKPLTCFEKLWTGKMISIEDPFDVSHNLGARISGKVYHYIFTSFKNAYKHFTSSSDYLPECEDAYEHFFFNYPIFCGCHPEKAGFTKRKKVNRIYKDSTDKRNTNSTCGRMHNMNCTDSVWLEKRKQLGVKKLPVGSQLLKSSDSLTPTSNSKREMKFSRPNMKKWPLVSSGVTDKLSKNNLSAKDLKISNSDNNLYNSDSVNISAASLKHNCTVSSGQSDDKHASKNYPQFEKSLPKFGNSCDQHVNYIPCNNNFKAESQNPLCGKNISHSLVQQSRTREVNSKAKLPCRRDDNLHSLGQNSCEDSSNLLPEATVNNSNRKVSFKKKTEKPSLKYDSSPLKLDESKQYLNRNFNSVSFSTNQSTFGKKSSGESKFKVDSSEIESTNFGEIPGASSGKKLTPVSAPNARTDVNPKSTARTHKVNSQSKLLPNTDVNYVSQKKLSKPQVHESKIQKHTSKFAAHARKS